MKRAIKICLFMLMGSILATAQTEIIIPSKDSLSIRGITHCLDKNDNVYILGTLNSFDSSVGLPAGGDFTYGSILQKVDNNGNLIWNRFYPIAYTSGNSGGSNMLPAKQINTRNDSIFIPYNINIGLVICDSNAHGTSAAFTSKDGILILDAYNGDTLKNNVFYDAPQFCGMYNLSFTAQHPDHHTSYLYYDASHDTFYVNERNADYYFVKNTEYPIYKNAVVNFDFTNINYDSITDQYITVNNYEAHIYSAAWNLLSTLALPYADSIKDVLGCNITCNGQFYVVNYFPQFFPDSQHTYTAVFTKKGDLVSCKRSGAFTDIVLTADNNLFALSSLQYGSLYDTIYHPVSFVEMDLFQNIKRKKEIGLPFVLANKISITSKNEVVITGTSYTSNPRNYPKHPDGIYYFKQDLKDIPLKINSSSICDDINLFPNPTKNTTCISSSSFNLTYNSTVEVYDLLGKQHLQTTWREQDIILNMSTFNSGVYIIKIYKTGSFCTLKVIKD